METYRKILRIMPLIIVAFVLFAIDSHNYILLLIAGLMLLLWLADKYRWIDWVVGKFRKPIVYYQPTNPPPAQPTPPAPVFSFTPYQQGYQAPAQHAQRATPDVKDESPARWDYEQAAAVYPTQQPPTI